MSQQTAFAPNQLDSQVASQGYVALSSSDGAHYRVELRAQEVSETHALVNVRIAFQINDSWDIIPWVGGQGQFWSASANCSFPLEQVPSELLEVFERNIVQLDACKEAGIGYADQPKLWMDGATEPCLIGFTFRAVLTDKGIHKGVITGIELPLGKLVWAGHGTGSKAPSLELTSASTQCISFAAAPAVASQAAPNPGNAADALVRS